MVSAEKYTHIPTGRVSTPSLWTPTSATEPVFSGIVVVPPFTPIPEGGAEQVSLDVLKILKLQGAHVVVTTTADSQVGDAAHVMLSPYDQAARRKQWYQTSDGQPVFAGYERWEYYDRYYQKAEEMIAEYSQSAEPGPSGIIFMYSNTYDRMFLDRLARLGRNLGIPTACIWNTVFPQDPLQAAWWKQKQEPYADLIAAQTWMGYSDAMGELRPEFMPNYLGSFHQPVGEEIFDQPLLEKDIQVAATTTATPGKCVHMLVEACGRRKLQLRLVTRNPQGAEQQRYWHERVQPAINRHYDYIRVHEELPVAEAVQVKRRAKVYANPSLYIEPYGDNAQASALGAFVVAFGTGGFLDSVQEGRTGSLVPVPQGVSYLQVLRDRDLEEALIESLADRLEWAVRSGETPSPEEIRENTRQRNSYEAVGPRLMELLHTLPQH